MAFSDGLISDISTAVREKSVDVRAAEDVDAVDVSWLAGVRAAGTVDAVDVNLLGGVRSLKL